MESCLFWVVKFSLYCFGIFLWEQILIVFSIWVAVILVAGVYRLVLLGLSWARES